MKPESKTDVTDEPETPPAVRCSDLLAGWSVQRRSYGIGETRGGTGDVLSFGKWGVVGGTGSYHILFPHGWIEDRPKFKTEIEAMLWVKAKTEPKPANSAITKRSADKAL